MTALAPAPVDWAPFTAAAQRAGERLLAAATAIREFGANLSRSLTQFANGETHVSRLEARFYVRGGLACTTGLADIDALVHGILTAPETQTADEFEAALFARLSPCNRGRLAAAAIAGYAEATSTVQASRLPWHRLIGDSTIVVTQGPRR